MKMLIKTIVLVASALTVNAQTMQLDVLASFDLPGGASPRGNLVQGPDGSFYGTTSAGGSSEAGTVFKVVTNGTLTTLISFDGANGSYPL